MSKTKHIVITRFSVRMRAGFGDDAIPREWLDRRLRLLETYAVPGMRAQTTNDYSWVLLCDESTDGEIVDQLLDLRRQVPGLVVGTLSETRGWKHVVRELLDDDTEVLITTRVDSDDALHCDALRTVQRYAAGFAHAGADGPLVVNFTRGWQFQVETSIVTERWYPVSPFLSMIETVRGDRGFRAVMHGRHTEVPGEHTTHQDLSIVGWLQVVHGGNIANEVTSPNAMVANANLGDFGFADSADAADRRGRRGSSAAGATPVNELQIATIAGPTLQLALDAAGVELSAPALYPDGADLLIVDSAGLRAKHGSDPASAVRGLLEWAEATQTPAVYWATGPAATEIDQLDLASGFAGVAAADATIAAQIIDQRRAVLMPWPAVLPLADNSSAARLPTAAFVGSWSANSPINGAWLHDMIALFPSGVVQWIDLAPHLGDPFSSTTAVPEGIPAPAGRSSEAAIACLRTASIVIAADPSARSQHFISPMYMTALASGAAVLAPHQRTLGFSFVRRPAFLTKRGDRDANEALVRSLLETWDLETRERVAGGPRLVKSQHTVEHRLAALASLGGVLALPPVGAVS